MEKDIHFTDKKVDESWKEQALKEKGGGSKNSAPSSTPEQECPSQSSNQTSKIFFNFMTSLGIQALMHLGEMPNPENNAREVNLDAAREIVDLLIAVKEKTRGNLGAEERQFFDSFLPELQIKFAQKA